MATNATVRGRFAPSPSGRMHLGNLFAALLAWLDVRHLGGELLLRMEDLDPDRCRPEYLSQLADDLIWLGLDWDLGWRPGETAYCQSCRTPFYQAAFKTLASRGLVYPCYCSRKERLAASAPHAADGARIYSILQAIIYDLSDSYSCNANIRKVRLCVLFSVFLCRLHKKRAASRHCPM